MKRHLNSQLIAALLALTFCAAPAHAQLHYLGHDHDVYINLLRPLGAECTFRRDGAALAVQRDRSLNPDIGFEVDWIDISVSHADVTLTCKTADGWQESRTLSYGPYEIDSFLAACGIPQTSEQPCPPGGIQVAKSIGYGYLPGFIRMRHDSPSAPGDRLYVRVDVLRPVDAVCSFRRDGSELAVVKIISDEPNVGSETDRIDVTDSHGDVTITCKAADGWQESRTLTYSPVEITQFEGPCAVAMRGTPCPAGPWTGRAIIHEYLPRFIPMRRDDPAAH